MKRKTRKRDAKTEDDKIDRRLRRLATKRNIEFSNDVPCQTRRDDESWQRYQYANFYSDGNWIWVWFDDPHPVISNDI